MTGRYSLSGSWRRLPPGVIPSAGSDSRAGAPSAREQRLLDGAGIGFTDSVAVSPMGLPRGFPMRRFSCARAVSTAPAPGFPAVLRTTRKHGSAGDPPRRQDRFPPAPWPGSRWLLRTQRRAGCLERLFGQRRGVIAVKDRKKYLSCALLVELVRQIDPSRANSAGRRSFRNPRCSAAVWLASGGCRGGREFSTGRAKFPAVNAADSAACRKRRRDYCRPGRTAQNRGVADSRPGSFEFRTGSLLAGASTARSGLLSKALTTASDRERRCWAGSGKLEKIQSG